MRSGKGRELMPFEHEPSYFSAKRYFDLYSGSSVEAKLFNYESKMREISNIKIPVLSIFGSKEEFAAMPPRRMLRILSQKFKHPYSKTALIKDADHCFCLKEEEAEAVVSKWLRNLVW
jgi:pimeloyl-ACP methyl ester carboxylesterase